MKTILLEQNAVTCSPPFLVFKMGEVPKAEGVAGVACPDALFGVDDYDAEQLNGVTVYHLLRPRKQTIVDMRADCPGGEACR